MINLLRFMGTNLNSQLVQIELIDEKGRLIERSDINFMIILDNLYQKKEYKKQYPLLSTIDYNGLTVFNYMQVPLVVKELQHLSKRNDSITKEISERVINFMNKIHEHVHLYIRFVGD
jgi:hypothetical protein